VKKVAAQYNCLWAGGLCPTSIYGHGGSKKDVQEYFKGQAEIFVRHDSDFLIVEVGKFLYTWCLKKCNKYVPDFCAAKYCGYRRFNLRDKF
jgi:hypothetical protein